MVYKFLPTELVDQKSYGVYKFRGLWVIYVMGYEGADCITEMCRESMRLAHCACLLYHSEHATGPSLMNTLTEIKVRELRFIVSLRYSEV